MSRKIISKLITIALVLITHQIGGSQNIDYKFVPSGSEGVVKSFPFIGGITNPQFSNIDFNSDGKQDLFVFDKMGDVILPFVYTGTNGSISYEYHPEYKSIFPEMKEWALLRDYNNDGIQDIFCFSYEEIGSGTQVYKGVINNGVLIYEKQLFEQHTSHILFYDHSGGRSGLYTPSSDIPSIEDIDNDGDLDILSFEIDGGYLYYYKNLVVEEGLPADTFKFVQEDLCWGKFFESGIIDSIYLSTDPNDCFHFKLPAGTKRHAGSTTLALDLDGDMDKDLLLGDITTYGLLALTNGGDENKAWITEQDKTFPSYDKQLEMDGFLASFYVDVNNDGKRDLIATPNQPGTGRTRNHIWLYLNEGEDNHPVFSFHTENFLVDETINMGSATKPRFIDYNGDGLMDIIVGSNGYYEDGGERLPRLFLLRNQGTKSEPNYALIDDNYLDLFNFSEIIGSPSPAVGDIDNDNDQDLLVGLNNGSMIYYQNLAGSGQAVNFDNSVYPFIDFFLGTTLSPYIFDLNGDNLNDIVVGEKNNSLNYYQNQGSAGSYQFESDITLPPNSETLGNIFTSTQDFERRNGTPTIFESEGQKYLFLGYRYGKMELFEISEDPINGDYFLVNDDFENIREGYSIGMDIADIDDDGLYELLIGNSRGGVSFYDTDISSSKTVNTNEASLENVIRISNPVSNKLIFYSNGFQLDKLEIYDHLGRLILSDENVLNNEINVSSLQSGHYLIKINRGEEILKMVKI